MRATLAADGAGSRHRPIHQSHGRAGPLGGQLHLVAGFDADFFTVEDRGRTGVQMVLATGGGSRNIISGSSSLDDVQFTSDGRTMIYTEETGSRPAEIFRADSSGGTEVALTHLNDALLSQVQLTPLDEMSVESADKNPRACLRGEAAGIQRNAEISGAFSDSWRAAGRLGRNLELPLERAGVRGPRDTWW